MNKEQVYDEKLSPLVAQVISICQEHGIAMIASFAIPTETDPDLACTSMLPDGAGERGPGHLRALAAIQRVDSFTLALTTAH